MVPLKIIGKNVLYNKLSFMENLFSITIGRQLGSGGKQIGEKLAQQLGISFYDKELIDIASGESGVGKTFFEQADETTSHSIFGGDLFGWPSTIGSGHYPNSFLSNETLFTIQSNVIRQLAEKRSCLFVGRCADYILTGKTNCLTIFICADMDDRVKRVMRIKDLSESKCRDFIVKTDKRRSSYYNYFSGKTWGSAESYHLCINSSKLGIDATIAFLKLYIEDWLSKIKS